MQIKEFTEFIYTLAEKSGDVIRPYFAKANLAVEVKEDQTLVTQADREAEAAMRALIRKVYPHHGILGEEFGPENASAEFVWTLDPIDGTISFASGCPLFGTLIGLLHADRPVLGAIHHPILNQLCIGNNTETTLPVFCEVAEVYDSQATLLTTDIASIGNIRRKKVSKIAETDEPVSHLGDCYGCSVGCLRRGYARSDWNPWDILL
jgi:myo-inositol-1(or 4)-monophosphatase